MRYFLRNYVIIILRGRDVCKPKYKKLQCYLGAIYSNISQGFYIYVENMYFGVRYKSTACSFRPNPKPNSKHTRLKPERACGGLVPDPK